MGKAADGFPVILVLLDGQPAPGLPFLRQLHWIITRDPASEKNVGRMLTRQPAAAPARRSMAAHGALSRPRRHGGKGQRLFLRPRATKRSSLSCARSAPDRLPVADRQFGRRQILAGAGRRACGVYASGLAGRGTKEQMSLAASFQRQPALVLPHAQPGTEPVRALVEQFFRAWQFEADRSGRAKRQTKWVEESARRRSKLARSSRRNRMRGCNDLHQPKPPGFLLYVDQGEELYVRAEERARHRLLGSFSPKRSPIRGCGH